MNSDLAVNELPSAIIALDSEGIITQWNNSAASIFGFSKSEMVGETLALIIPLEIRPFHMNGFHTALQTGMLATGGDPVKVTAVTKSAEKVDLLMRLQLRLDEQMLPVGAVAEIWPVQIIRPLLSYIEEQPK